MTVPFNVHGMLTLEVGNEGTPSGEEVELTDVISVVVALTAGNSVTLEVRTGGATEVLLSFQPGGMIVPFSSLFEDRGPCSTVEVPETAVPPTIAEELPVGKGGSSEAEAESAGADRNDEETVAFPDGELDANGVSVTLPEMVVLLVETGGATVTSPMADVRLMVGMTMPLPVCPDSVTLEALPVCDARSVKEVVLSSREVKTAPSEADCPSPTVPVPMILEILVPLLGNGGPGEERGDAWEMLLGRVQVGNPVGVRTGGSWFPGVPKVLVIRVWASEEVELPFTVAEKANEEAVAVVFPVTVVFANGGVDVPDAWVCRGEDAPGLRSVAVTCPTGSSVEVPLARIDVAAGALGPCPDSSASDPVGEEEASSSPVAVASPEG
jgi:hypothetical protein